MYKGGSCCRTSISFQRRNFRVQLFKGLDNPITEKSPSGISDGSINISRRNLNTQKSSVILDCV